MQITKNINSSTESEFSSQPIKLPSLIKSTSSDIIGLVNNFTLSYGKSTNNCVIATETFENLESDLYLNKFTFIEK